MKINLPFLTKKDYYFSILTGTLIGLLILPVLKAAKPSLFENFAFLIFIFFFVAVPTGTILASFISRKIAAVWQIAKFGVIGVLNTLVDLGVLAALTFAFRTYFEINSSDAVFAGFILTYYSILKASSFIVANVNSYFWNKYWTFESNSSQKKSVQFLQFFVVSLIGMVVNVLIASTVVELAPFGSLNSDQIGLLGAVAGAVSGLAWNFIGYKFIVFKEK